MEPSTGRDAPPPPPPPRAGGRSHARRVVLSLLAFAALVAGATGVIMLLIGVFSTLGRGAE